MDKEPLIEPLGVDEAVEADLRRDFGYERLILDPDGLAGSFWSV